MDQEILDKLHEHAVEAMKNAYAPYSKYKVGAAALTDSGEIVTGCNVENASYGLSLCAECGLISNLKLRGLNKIKYFVCVNANGDFIAPCGRCRQLLFEHSIKDESKFYIKDKVYTRDELLPASWDFD